MLEVELKFRLPDAGSLIARLELLGAVEHLPAIQVDHYFNHPSRNFAETDEALRIRCSNDTIAMTYKGPLVDSETKTRREIELEFADRAAEEKLPELLMALGFRPVMAVRKHRRTWHLEKDGRAIEVALDKVEGLGQFVELETCALSEELPQARDLLKNLAGTLGLVDGERRGYLTLLKAQNRA